MDGLSSRYTRVVPAWQHIPPERPRLCRKLLPFPLWLANFAGIAGCLALRIGHSVDGVANHNPHSR